jgi:Icc-related predicted phosphoesterase
VGRILREGDVVVVAGDITDFGSAEEARPIITALQEANPNLLAVHGNCDQLDVNDMLNDAGVSIHLRSRQIDENWFYGVGGSNISPFHTPQEIKDEQLAELLSNCNKPLNVKKHIFVTHAPPFNTKVDRTFFGAHVGSKSVRSYIEKFTPDLVLCGHIHEARGVDRIGNSLIINPGPFPAHYAMVTISEKITYTLV